MIERERKIGERERGREGEREGGISDRGRREVDGSEAKKAWKRGKEREAEAN